MACNETVPCCTRGCRVISNVPIKGNVLCFGHTARILRALIMSELKKVKQELTLWEKLEQRVAELGLPRQPWQNKYTDEEVEELKRHARTHRFPKSDAVTKLADAIRSKEGTKHFDETLVWTILEFVPREALELVGREAFDQFFFTRKESLGTNKHSFFGEREIYHNVCFSFALIEYELGTDTWIRLDDFEWRDVYRIRVNRYEGGDLPSHRTFFYLMK